ncbi:G-protein coupled estrogen receptor 1 [Physeter macrocephalus]|uniref:G-protein coupled estrogen receptor 1 n=1 Tax=Physeter macrocephalus TaxID=9755 RepID=A0A2Y9F4I6_PHYMC|nr:G-protein coupled estrogen receptor 1 [Physeter catodon]XP_028354399.1 G-protein coupled estrogen receptor 1 [Physeter catodon]XP_054945920.1 G-protein coupled estrogen receptor 1 [Physeter catodon]XP_054945921.1 G-protein coupled estrogen receptor 1 [Physeter catodon]|eukprot:XP_007114924.1 G-protein coupled estrogen receptor 1 [Physeter catodon]
METRPGAYNGSPTGLGLPGPLANSSAALSEQQQYAIGLFLSCLYTVFLFPIGFVGNLLILVVNIRFRERMTIPDLYFINLAAADLVLVADSLIEVFNLDKQYYDITALCTFMSLFLQVNMYSSVFFLTWMSFDRYLALAKAVRCGPFRTKPRARLSCGLIWMASVSATLVPFTAVHLQHSEDVCFCFADVREVQWLEVTLGFVVPFATIGLCYSLIARVLVTAHRPRGLRPRRQKALRMILAVVLVFFVCWLPENVFISVHLLQRAPPGAGPCQRSPRHAHPLAGHVVNLAAFSNSCLNPLVYSFLGETFRDKLRLYLEQKTGLSALNRFCHAALKAVVPDSSEQAEVKFSSAV